LLVPQLKERSMTPLKLVALDDTDLAIVSAHCQDAVCKVGDLEWTPARKQFLVQLNRFAWEASSGWFRQHNERRRSALLFDRVLSVRTTGVDREKPEEVLELLALRWEPGDVPSGVIELVFAGKATIRLSVECIETSLSDLGGAWEAAARPMHQV
jgi:hypothetical protein